MKKIIFAALFSSFIVAGSSVNAAFASSNGESISFFKGDGKKKKKKNCDSSKENCKEKKSCCSSSDKAKEEAE
ncbi:MAG TPA: hypothetical protein VF691_08750 [Cytophagaceae bacterium]|jgi:hypothetical protein